MSHAKNYNISLRSELAQHKKIKSLLNPISKYYFSLTGPLHILPDYLIIGAAKSGTTSLYDYLIQHPHIASASGKEIYFFDMNYNKGINWYKTFFPLSIQKISKNFITGEATPRYLDHPHSPNRIKKHLPNAKFIILLRNPVDRAYSHWNMMINHKREDLSFEEAINTEKQRTQGLYEKMKKEPNYYSKCYFWYSYLERGIYVNKIKHWFDYFPKEQFLFIKSEDMFENTNQTYNDVLNFLELPPHSLASYTKTKKGNYKKKQMNESTREKLAEFYRPYNKELYKLIDKKFNWEL